MPADLSIAAVPKEVRHNKVIIYTAHQLKIIVKGELQINQKGFGVDEFGVGYSKEIIKSILEFLVIVLTPDKVLFWVYNSNQYEQIWIRTSQKAQ